MARPQLEGLSEVGTGKDLQVEPGLTSSTATGRGLSRSTLIRNEAPSGFTRTV